MNYLHKNFHLRYSTGRWIRPRIGSFSEYFASLNLSSLCYCINNENSYEKQKNEGMFSRLQKYIKNSTHRQVLPNFREHPRVLLHCSFPVLCCSVKRIVNKFIFVVDLILVLIFFTELVPLSGHVTKMIYVTFTYFWHFQCHVGTLDNLKLKLET